MKQRITSYRARIDALLSAPPEGTCWERVIEEHLIQIGFFQHERLIHLIVTVLFALLTMLSAGIALTARFWSMLLVTAALLVLLIPYIAHYYTLENEVQKMYGQYDRMLELCNISDK